MIRGTPGLRPTLTDRQEDAPVCLCGRCKGEMYAGEEKYIWQDKRICPDCFKTVVSAWLEEAAQEVACALGVESGMV